MRNWPRALADHLELVGTDYTCHLRSGLRLAVRGGTDDRHVIFEVFVKRVYPISIVPGEIVVDIGANIGAFTLAAAQAGARVLSFEPCAENAAILERNVRLNGLESVRVFALAVGRDRRRRKLFIPDDPSWTGRQSLQPGRGTRTADVSCISLDDVVVENGLDRIDILKIDCEGGEYEILFSVSADTLARIRTIVAEVHEPPATSDCWSPAGLHEYLRSRGFDVSERRRIVRAQRGGPYRSVELRTDR